MGSGLASAVLARIDGRDLPYARLGIPAPRIAGHAGIARVGRWGGRRVAAFAGRLHLYRGHDAPEVTALVRLAHAAGARTIVLTNAAGGLNPHFAVGDVMAIADHINLTGTSPIVDDDDDPFVDMRDAYAPYLRERARAQTAFVVREGVYAGVRGPQYETAAESEMLRRLGADAVGMSTVLETIAARRLGMAVLGLSLITNAIAPERDVSHAEVLAASRAGSERIAAVVASILTAEGDR